MNGKYIRTPEIREKNRQASLRNSPRKESHPYWRGGKRYNDAGYIMILQTDHPFANGSGYVREHRLIVEKCIGRYLKPEEIIHHINGIKDDNRIENLEITNSIDHGRRHHTKNRKCSICSCKHLSRGYCETHYWMFYLKDHKNKKFPRKYTFLQPNKMLCKCSMV